MDNARLYREAGEQRDLYEALLRAQSELGEAFALIEDERIVFANAATERMLGRSAEEIQALRVRCSTSCRPSATSRCASA